MSFCDLEFLELAPTHPKRTKDHSANYWRRWLDKNTYISLLRQNQPIPPSGNDNKNNLLKLIRDRSKLLLLFNHYIRNCLRRLLFCFPSRRLDKIPIEILNNQLFSEHIREGIWRSLKRLSVWRGEKAVPNVVVYKILKNKKNSPLKIVKITRREEQFADKSK